MLNKVKRFSQHSAVYIVGSALTKGVTFLMVPIYVSKLSATEYGILGITTVTYSALVIIFSLALQGAVSRYYYDYRDESEQLRNYLGTAAFALVAWSLILVLLSSIGGPPLFQILLPEVPFYPYILLTVIAAFFFNFSTIPLVLFRVREQPVVYAVYSLLLFLFTLGLNLLFVVYLDWGVVGSLLGNLLGNALVAVAFAVILVRNINFKLNWGHLGQSLAYSLPLVPHLLAGWLLKLSDRFILGRYTALSEVGIYNLATQITLVQSLIGTSISNAWTPFFFSEAPAGEEGAKTIARFATYFVFALTLLALGLSLVSKELILLISSLGFSEYEEAYRVVPPLAAAYLCLGLYYVVVNGLFYQKQTNRLFAITGGCGVLNVLLNIILVPRFGMMASALSQLVGYCLMAVLAWRASQQAYPLPYEYRRIGSLLGVAVASYWCGWFVDQGNWHINLLIKTFFVLLYPLILWVLGFFHEDEIRAILSILRSRHLARS